MIKATLVQFVKVPFKGRDEVISIAEAEELRCALTNVICANSATTERIRIEVCNTFNVRPDELDSDARPDRIAFPRQVAMWLHRVTTDMSLNDIGARFPRLNGKPRDHGTVLHAYRAVENRIRVDSKAKARVMAIHKVLTS